MDSLEEPPTKKRCIIRNGNKIQLIECVREFRLPQQFPSTLKQAMEQGIVNTIESPSSMMPKNIKVLPGIEHQVSYKPQKLRIISANGKDLGEFNMQLRTDDPLKGQTIMITKNTINPDKKPMSAVMSPILQNKMLPRILKQGTAKVLKNLMDIKSCNKNNSETNIINMSQQSTNLPINKKLLIKNQDVETRNKEAHTMCNNNIKVEIPISTNDTTSKQFMHESINNNSHQNHVVHNGISNVNSHKKIPHITITEDDETSAEKVSYKEIIELPFPIVNCKKLVLNSNSNDMHRSEDYIKVSKKKYITSMKNTENEKIITSLKNAINFAHKYNQINSNLSKNHLDNNSKENINNGKILNKNNSFQVNSDIGFINNQVYKTMQKNVMTIIPNNETFLFNQNTILTPYNSAESSVSEKNGINVHHGKIISRHDIKGENMQSKYVLKNGFENNCSVAVVDNVQHIESESQQITNSVDSIMQLDEQNKDYTKDSTPIGLSDQLNIIKKAMDSVKDDKLRALALKALEECGIGIKRYVPIPEKHKAVNDTQVQTMVFGLLDPESFVFINKDLDNIERMNQITLCDISSNQDQLLTNSLHFDSLSKAPIIEQENDFDIDSFLKEMEEDLDVMKMKETLSVTKIRCKNLLEHLEKDFESVKRYDQNGMLNIHNAVISNNIHFVQRQLMILEQCKESVDILTENEMTSLELAVKYDVQSEIVKLLLKAGAQPVIPKYIHESALIIASKQSSPLLSMLIDHVSDSKLLDQIDSEGFAALHYCSMRNNVQGVKVLISAGATVDLKDMRSGRTSLFHALDNGHTAVTQTLLKAGAITNITNYAGQTPIPVVTEKIFRNVS